TCHQAAETAQTAHTKGAADQAEYQALKDLLVTYGAKTK
ncbi:MAG: hypothetical protein K940chlam2_01612, partial [Chlamydiae bacterium]|nr:hypothetical protein [Chlamydiota bacterium]